MARVPLVSPRSLVSLLVTTVLAFCLGAALQSAAPGQQQPSAPATASASKAEMAEPTMLMLTMVDVRPDMVDDYIAFQKNETIPALQKAGIPWRDAWRTGMFGSTYTVAFLTPITTFAQFDGPTPIEKALGEDGAKAYNAKASKMVTSIRRSALRVRSDLGYRTEGAAMPKLGVLASVDVVAGKQPEFETILKMEWAPALKKAGVPSYHVTQVVMGGGITSYYTFTPIENFAVLDKGHPIQQTLGEAGLNKLMARLGPTIQHTERVVIRYDDELSFRTKATSQVR